MSQKWFNNIDLQQNELQNGVIQNLAADPTSGKAGQIYYNTADKGYRYHNGTAWVSITTEAVKSIIAGNGLTSSGTDTVTISLGTPSSSGSGSNTFGSNGLTATSHTHQISLPDATEAAKGVIELATDAEAAAGTDTTRAINAKQLAAAKQSAIDSAKVTIQTSNGITGGSTTPGNSFTLSGVDASATEKGVVQLATQDEVNTGTNTTKVITPATLGKGKASGVASLDANSKIITSQLPDYLLGQVMYGGNASTVATTTIVSPSDSLKAKKNITATSISIVNSATSTAANTYGWQDMEGVYFICQASGTFAGVSFETGDWIISTGSAWEKIDNTDAIKSVNGQTGVVNITRVDKAGTADKVAQALTIGPSEVDTGKDVKYDGSGAKRVKFDKDDFDYTTVFPTDDITFHLKTTGVAAGNYNNIMVDTKGRVVAGERENYAQTIVKTFSGDGSTTIFDLPHSLNKDVMVQIYLTGQTVGSDTVDELVMTDVYTAVGKIKVVFASAPGTSQNFKAVITGMLPSFEEMDWASVRSVILAGDAAKYLSVGDTKSVTSKSGKTYTIRVADMQSGRYDYSDNSGSSKVTFEFVETYNLNGTGHWKIGSNVGDSWNTCSLRTSTMPAILADLPDDMVAAMSQVKVLSGVAGDASSGIVSSNDKLFLPAEVELFDASKSSIGISESPLGQFDYYKANNTDASRIKYLIGYTTSTQWWERSPDDGSDYYWCCVASSGQYSRKSVDNSFGVSPIFAI